MVDTRAIAVAASMLRAASENAELGEHGLADRDALGDVGRGRRHIDVQCKSGELPVSFDPSGPPADVRRAGEAPSCLAVQNPAALAFKPDDVARDRLRTGRCV